MGQLHPDLDGGTCLELDATCFGLLVWVVAGFKAHILAQHNQQDEVDQRQQQESCSTCGYMAWTQDSKKSWLCHPADAAAPHSGATAALKTLQTLSCYAGPDLAVAHVDMTVF